MDMSPQTLWMQMSWMAKGVVVVLLIMSIYSIWVMVERYLTFQKAKNQSLKLLGALSNVLTRGDYQQAIDMKRDYFEAMAYLNLLWRQQALVDAQTDPVKAQADVAQADAIRNRAIEIIKQKKAASGKKS